MKQLISIALICSAAACNCNQPPAKPVLLDEGQNCTNDDLCKTGLCEAAEGFQPVCVRKCSSGCQNDEICEQLTPNRFTCVPNNGGLCQSCNIDSDCPYPADKCIVVSNEKVCGRDCAFDQRCPTSYQCVNGLGTDGKAKAQQCTPSSGSCLCTAASTGQMISCEVENGFGKCRGHRTCDGLNGYGACDAKTPGTETCNGLDDDCDGTTDEDLGAVTCGEGICRRTVPMCTAGATTQCTPGPSMTEQCNGLDDDCNGMVDNGFNLMTDVNNCATCGHVCTLSHATPKCDAATCKVDTCDMGFGNCDRNDPNGCEVNTNTDAMNCGACGRVCMATGANATCTNGMCSFTCQPGHIDLNMDLSDGCEYACTFQSATDVPDLQFTDANCDGIDGELNNGIFVAPAVAGGNDANPGTRTSPKGTIGGGLNAAVTQNKRDVYVSAGTFVGQLTIANVSGKIVAGGYALPDWRRSLINTSTLTGGNPTVKVTQVDGGTLQFFTVLGSNAGGTGTSAYGAWVVSSNNISLEGLTLSSGDGTDGTDGPDGGVGTAGGNGGLGDRGCTNDPDLSFICAVCNPPSVGAAGTGACGENGGTGGTAGWTSNPPPGNGSNGGPGSGPTTGGFGVAPAFGYSGQPIPAFADGQTGADGTAGGNGLGAPILGSLTATGYVTPVATGGTPGSAGKGGGGGGGGGGGCAKSLFDVLCVCWSYGSTGGGGGSGGCAGGAGQPGQSGGASVGVLLWNSTVSATNTAVTTGRGGNGGKGGNGGLGGNGGTGFGSQYDNGAQGEATMGGKGGNGGKGGTSGHGGGGSGGAVIGVARNAGSTFNQTNVSFTLGVAGTAGPSAGNPGQNGTSVQVQAF